MIFPTIREGKEYMLNPILRTPHAVSYNTYLMMDYFLLCIHPLNDFLQHEMAILLFNNFDTRCPCLLTNNIDTRWQCFLFNKHPHQMAMFAIQPRSTPDGDVCKPTYIDTRWRCLLINIHRHQMAMFTNSNYHR